jgi:hypothetical protein
MEIRHVSLISMSRRLGVPLDILVDDCSEVGQAKVFTKSYYVCYIMDDYSDQVSNTLRTP